MLTLLDPKTIMKSENIIDELAQFGIDHRNNDANLGWNYVLDHVWLTLRIEKYLESKNKNNMVILDVGCGKSPFHNFLEKKLGINIIGINRPQGYCHQDKTKNVDYYVDFMDMDVFAENSVDIVYWLSAIEHNQKHDIHKLYQKSMSLLKEDGLFLATIPVSEKTFWFTDSEQTNLSIEDSKNIFLVDKIEGDLGDIREKYRQNYLHLRDKYQNRYKKFGHDDPQFIVGAVSKIKVHAAEKKLSTLPAQLAAVESSPVYLFQPSNDTHVHWMLPLAKKLSGSKFMIHPGKRKNEGADDTLQKLGEKFYSYQPGLLRQIRPDVVIFGCDWGGLEKEIIAEARILGIPTVCIQEGCLDFIDQRADRMLHADYAFLQGPIMRKFIRRTENVFVTGNPKYDSLYEAPLPAKPLVMINCNFTYNLHEDARDSWVRDVVEVCRHLGLNFFVSLHPRDKGVFPADYNVIKSDAFKMHHQLVNSSVLVSRFSTVIYEAMMMGRNAVYYNPHNEYQRIFAQDDTGGIALAKNRNELVNALSFAVLNLGKNKTNRDKFLQLHCATLNHDATLMCIKQLTEIASNYRSQAGLVAVGNVPTVSVIIPCYNTAKYLNKAIESVLTQTFTDFELLVIDDGSTDDTAEVTKSFNDSRIKYIYQQNKGLSGARNSGIRNSHGKYVTFLDADDYFLPDKLKTQVEFLETYTDYGLVGGAFLRVDENCNLIKTCSADRGPMLPERIFVKNAFVIHATLIRRKWLDIVVGFDETLRASEDRDFHCRLAKAGCLMYQTGEVVCAYRFRADSMSADYQAQTNNMLKVVGNTFGSVPDQSEISGLECNTNGLVHMRAAVYSYAAGQADKGKYHFEQALISNPDYCMDNYKEIVSLMISYADHMNIECHEKFFKFMLDNLPHQAEPMRRLYNVLVYRTQSNRKLKFYKDRHHGQRCFIINNGHDLDKIDFSLLKNEITFGLDDIYLWSGKAGFDPTYYLCFNQPLIDCSFEKIQKMRSAKFLDAAVLPLLKEPQDMIFLCCCGLKFAKDPVSGIGDGFSTAYLAMQIAYFMGFAEVILIGQNHKILSQNQEKFNNGSDQPIRFDLHYSGESCHGDSVYLERVNLCYKMAAYHFNSEGRRIVDATLNSELDIFPRADFRQFLTGKQQTISLKSLPSSKRSLWAELGSVQRPDSIKNLYGIADSYHSMGEYEISEKLYEKIFEPLKKAVNGIDLTACHDFKNSTELADCFFSFSTRLAMCYSKHKEFDKMARVYFDLLTAKYLTIPKNHQLEMIDVLKKYNAVSSNFKLQNNNQLDLQVTPDTGSTIAEVESAGRSNIPNNVNTPITSVAKNGQLSLVSVIMPAYNAQKYISGAIDSVLKQTYQNFELIVINDGSTDRTADIIAGFKDPRIRYFHQSNRGLAATHNEGIRKAKGDFVIKLDIDDLMTPDFIEKHIAEFQKNPDADLVYCDDYLIDQNGKFDRVIKRPEYTDNKLLIRDLFRNGFPIVPFRTCIRKSVFDAIGYFDETLHVAEDYDMMRRFVRKGLKAHHLPQPLYIRRLTSDSLSRNFTDIKAKSHFDVVRRFAETFSYDELFPDVEWDRIDPGSRNLHARCLAAVNILAIGNTYVKTDSHIYALTAFRHASLELNDCAKAAPANLHIKQLAQKCENARCQYESVLQQSF